MPQKLQAQAFVFTEHRRERLPLNTCGTYASRSQNQKREQKHFESKHQFLLLILHLGGGYLLCGETVLLKLPFL